MHDKRGYLHFHTEGSMLDQKVLVVASRWPKSQKAKFWCPANIRPLGDIFLKLQTAFDCHRPLDKI